MLPALPVTVTVAVPDLIYALFRQTPVLDSSIDDFLLLGFAIYILAHFSSLTVKPVQTASGLAGKILAETEAAAEAEPVDREDVEQISFFGDEPRPVELPPQPEPPIEETEDDLSIFDSPELPERPERTERAERPASGSRARSSSRTNKKS